MRNRRRTGLSGMSWVVWFGAWLAFSERGFGETAYPMLMSLNPVAAQIGQTTEHTLKSRYSMWGTFQVLVSGTGVPGGVVVPESKPDGKSDPKGEAKADEKGDEKAESKAIERPNLQEVTIRFHVADSAEPGVRDFRLATPQGASTVGQLVLVRQPVVREADENEALEKAQLVTLPAAICGRVEKNEDVDFYRFQAAAGQVLNFHVRSMRLQDRSHDLQTHVDPILMLLNTQGTTLAANDNYFYVDPFIHHRFEQAGAYVLDILEVRYRGN